MSRVQVGVADLCDNLPNPDALAGQTRNLNEANALARTRSLSPSHEEEEAGPIQKTSVNDNGKHSEEERGKEGLTGRGGEEDEEEDIDEVMKEEEEEEEESEESSFLISCQSPETPMTDSSFSETGSLLDTPYPFSPATSPEPTSPAIPEIAFLASQMEMSPIDVTVDSPNADIAEAFVLHKDYQRALWCIQLERLYHQRVLDNLNALQEQWGNVQKHAISCIHLSV
ncbi:Consortin [Liparis tanakae]|uniref:Consortin n=1 Tax=Liparis tanakae TaxID=230148 RepID=A0A4Z2H7K9_9TELE|nr:Consortin [Liparis tanakae]